MMPSVRSLLRVALVPLVLLGACADEFDMTAPDPATAVFAASRRRARMNLPSATALAPR